MSEGVNEWFNMLCVHALAKDHMLFQTHSLRFLIEEFQLLTASELQIADDMFRTLPDRHDDNGGLLRGELDDVERMGGGSLR